MAERRFGRIACLLAAIALVLVLAGGCAQKTQRPVQRPKPAPATKASEEVAIETAPVVPEMAAYKAAPVTAKVRDYTVAADLSNVRNLKIFKKLLTQKQRGMIARNGFVVTPTNLIQLFQVYESNAYERPLEIPSFITADAMLHQYHIFYDFSLRKLEEGKLYTMVEDLTSVMLKQSEKDYAEAKDPMVKDAARGNVAYFAVAASLLGRNVTPAYVSAEVKADLAKISGHKARNKSHALTVGVDTSKFVPVGVDFTMIVPRGHYTRSEKLKRYFNAMMWYGLAGMPLPNQANDSDVPTLRALLVTRALSVAKGSKPAMELWESVYEPTVFYVGSTDDLTPAQYLKISDAVYGKKPSIKAFGDKTKLAAFIARAKKLPKPGIQTAYMDEAPAFRIPNGLQLRFMGQRFVFDSRILQEMTFPKVEKRGFPKGLDVFAAIGSKRAYDIVDKVYHEPSEFPGYDKQMAKMRKEVAAIPRSRWQSNLYYGWMWSLQPMTGTFGKGYPSFMRNEAWTDRSLNTALGSWAEVRHDTILYAKQSAVECGGDGEKERPMPKGYVEPNVELWSRLLWLTDKTEQGLKKRGLLTDELAERFDWMSGTLGFLKTASIKELRNEELTREEYDRIRRFGAELESQMLQLYGGDVISETDKNMAVVADVHTAGDKCLEEGVGRAAAMYVVVPIGGKLWLTRGAVFTYYEFQHPASNRLTDEAWQKMLETGKAPGLPAWVRSFVEGAIKVEPPPSGRMPMPGGC